MFWKDPQKAAKMKIRLARSVGQREVLLESIPCLFILAFIFSDPDTKSIVQGSLFYFSALTSLLSAGLGLAKILMMGPCRILPPLSGFFNPQFFMTLVVCLSSLMAKAGVTVLWGTIRQVWCKKQK